MREHLEGTGWHLDKRVPIALIISVLAQGALGIWWISGLNYQIQTHEKRIEKIEQTNEKQLDILGKLNDRLARIEQSLADIKSGFVVHK